MTTIQELEKINTENYMDNPADLIPIAKQLLNLKKFEKGIELAETAIHYAIKKNGGDEANIQCAKFYHFYADALIRKCMESEEILAMPNGENDVVQEIPEQREEDEEEDQEGKEEKVESVPKNNIQGNNICHTNQSNNLNGNDDGPQISDVNEEKSDNEAIPQFQDDSDEQVAAENLFFAEKIYKTFLEKFESEDTKEIKEKFPEVIQYFFDLAQVYQKFGELEMCKSDFKSAVDFFDKSLQIRLKYDSKISRAVAELYFNMATAYDFDSKKCLLSYYKTKIIMEHHLKEELTKNGFTSLANKIKVHEEDLDLEIIPISSSNLTENKEITSGGEFNNEQILKNEDIDELLAIIAELNQKIEDVIIDINDFDKYVKEKEQLQQEQNQFTSDYDKTKVIDINSTGLVRKRQRKDENEDENLKEEGGRREKLEK